MNGFSSIESFFEDVDFDQQFDLVILSQVLEHLDNPLSTLSHVRAVLLANGIASIAVPIFDSFWIKIGLDGGVIWIPEHITYFSKKGLMKLLIRAGYDIMGYQVLALFLISI
jgi:2-polyprenyl-3-methyl-5-hydroxy-6-metoxy-1,4-benzoquinol methylase